LEILPAYACQKWNLTTLEYVEEHLEFEHNLDFRINQPEHLENDETFYGGGMEGLELIHLDSKHGTV
jgi:hypothetical protein